MKWIKKLKCKWFHEKYWIPEDKQKTPGITLGYIRCSKCNIIFMKALWEKSSVKELQNEELLRRRFNRVKIPHGYVSTRTFDKNEKI